MPGSKDKTETMQKRVQRAYDQQGYQLVGKNHLNKSFKYQNLIGDTLLMGGGLGLSWYAAKQLVERAYRKRLHRALLEDTGVTDTYENRVTPVENEFVTDELPINSKEAAFGKGTTKIYPAYATEGEARKFVADPNTSHFIMDPHQSPRTALAVEMAKSPAIAHSIAFASIPALFALATWGANEGAKKLFGKIVDDKVQPQDIEKRKARQEYEAAARMLRSVSQGDLERLEKEGTLKKEANPIIPILWGIGGGTALTAGGSYLWNKAKSGRPAPIEEPSAELNENKTVNSLMNLGLGLGALALLYPGYKFVQSLRKGYKDKAESVSDAQVALQAWNAQRQARDEDFATLRAALAEEPDLLQKYFNQDGTLKSNPQIT